MRDNGRNIYLFVREDVFEDLDGEEFAVGQVVVLLGFGAVGVPLLDREVLAALAFSELLGG